MWDSPGINTKRFKLVLRRAGEPTKEIKPDTVYIPAGKKFQHYMRQEKRSERGIGRRCDAKVALQQK